MGGIFSVQRGMRKVFNYLVHFINPGVDGKIILKWFFMEIVCENKTGYYTGVWKYI
jgi:hypothetical protein